MIINTADAFMGSQPTHSALEEGQHYQCAHEVSFTSMQIRACPHTGDVLLLMDKGCQLREDLDVGVSSIGASNNSNVEERHKWFVSHENVV